MSNTNYNNDFLKALQLPVEILDNYTPTAYDGTDSCFREGVDRCGNKATFLRLKSNTKDTHACPHCGCVDHHESKGLRTKKLTHISNYHCRFIIEVQYRRYRCKHCGKYFKDEVSNKVNI